MTKDKALYLLAGIIVGGFLGCIVALLLFKVPAENKEIVYVLVGILGASFTTVKDFFFGSSQGSKDKDAKAP